MTSYHFFLVAAVVISLVSAIVDARTGHIPNGVTFGALAVAPLVHASTAFLHTHSAHAAARSLGFSLLGAVLCALLPLAMYRSAGLGGGDVKLFAAIGATTDAFVGLHAQTYAFVCGMILALVVAARSGRLAATFGNVVALVTSTSRPRAGGEPAARPVLTRMPFGPAIFLGTAFASVVLWGAK
jgi:prepilin peptidase CpaA